MTASAEPAKKRRGGRERLVKDGDWKYIGCKAPPELHATFLEIGGSEWLRGELQKHADRIKRERGQG